jgi:hypothetical protein
MYMKTAWKEKAGSVRVPQILMCYLKQPGEDISRLSLDHKESGSKLLEAAVQVIQTL